MKKWLILLPVVAFLSVFVMELFFDNDPCADRNSCDWTQATLIGSDEVKVKYSGSQHELIYWTNKIHRHSLGEKDSVSINYFLQDRVSRSVNPNAAILVKANLKGEVLSVDDDWSFDSIIMHPDSWLRVLLFDLRRAKEKDIGCEMTTEQSLKFSKILTFQKIIDQLPRVSVGSDYTAQQ